MMMITRETDGFRALATWSRQGTIVPIHSRNPAQFANFDCISDPDGPETGGSRKKRMTAAERKVARNLWLNR
jgi:hypothetical protein